MDYIKKCASIIQKICSAHPDPGKKMVQKLMYLIERKGVEVGLNYKIHFFGPYSEKLDNALHFLESEDMVEIDADHGMTHVIKFCGTDEELDNALTATEQDIVDDVLSVFGKKTALELEALTTLDYAATALLRSAADDKKIIEQVKQIKGSKFSESELNKELGILKKYQYLN